MSRRKPTAHPKPERPKQAASADVASSGTSDILRYGPALLLCLMGLAFLLYESVWATLIVLGDGALAVIVWIAAIWLGWWAIRPLRLDDAPLRWRIVLSAGVGIGLMSLLVLLLGLLGVLYRVVWVAILGGMVVAYVVQAMAYLRRIKPGDAGAGRSTWQADNLLWLLAVPFLPLTLLVSTIPPGLSWPTEAGGYDVLTYHFGGPKEYWLAGRIIPLPHNVYTYFPFNAEMLYLLAFIVRGGPYDGVYLAQLLNASLAIWTVVAAWLGGREFGRTPGIVAGVLAATCPWLTYLSGVAFVENGLLFMCTLTTAVIARMWTHPECRRASWFFIAGLLVGLACGYKYTAVPIVAMPIGLVITCLAWAFRPRRWLGPVIFVGGLAITFGPWLAKNVAHAGNPVFPLGHRVFGCRAELWTEALAEKWDHAHAPLPDEATPGKRVLRLWQRILADPSYGPAIFAAALLGLPAVRGSRRGFAIACLVIVALQALVWMFATHLYARFGVPMIPTLIVLAAAGWSSLRTVAWARLHHAAVILVVVLGSLVNLVHMGRVYYHHTRYADGTRCNWFGAAAAVRRVDPINQNTPDEGAVIWLVGEGRAFYVDRPCYYHVVFSRDPLVEFARTGPTGPQLLDWFRRRGVTHVSINWSEIDRFRRPGNYGWPECVNESLFASMRSAGALLTHSERRAATGELVHEILEVPAQ